MGLSFRLAIAMISLVMLTAIGVGTVIHRGMMASGLPQELDRMRAHAGLVADEFRNHIEIAREDVQAIAGMPAVVRLAALHAEAHPGEDIEPERQLRTELAGQFLAILQAKKNYLRLRLIGTTDGMEIVRVSRKTAGTAASITPQALLQSKAHRPYFSASFDLGDGESMFRRSTTFANTAQSKRRTFPRSGSPWRFARTTAFHWH